MRDICVSCANCGRRIAKDTAGDWFHWSSGSIDCLTGHTEAQPRLDCIDCGGPLDSVMTPGTYAEATAERCGRCDLALAREEVGL